MKKSFSLLIAVIVIFVLAAMAYWFLSTESNIFGGNNLNVPGAVSGNNLNQNLLPADEGVLATDDFSLNYPEGWRSVPAMTGISAMIVRGNENITDPEAKKMNFQTYLAVSYDSVEEKTKEQVVEYVKNEVAAVIPEVVFSNEKFLTLDGREAYATEMTFHKSGLDFHVLEIVIWGEGNDLWILSYNTLEELWAGYVGEFEEITQAFRVK